MGALFSGAVGLAAWGLVQNSRSQAPPPEPTIAPGVMPQPTPSLLRSVPTIAEGKAALASTAPGAAEIVALVEGVQVAALLDRMLWQSGSCEQYVARGKDRCEAWGVAPGVVVEWLRPRPEFAVQLLRAAAAAELSYLLEGRHPRLQVLARRDDGAYLLSFAVDPKPGLMFPGALPEGGTPVGTSYLHTDPKDAAKIAGYGSFSVSTPPLEFARYDAFHGIHQYELLAASDEFYKAEQASHDEIEAGRKQKP
ncbi:MAG: hypothetical protein IT304_08750 [Dehalococcoidia bacterium]|nr:hypothetical protein [Dehalococcoidia bacterium]